MSKDKKTSVEDTELTQKAGKKSPRNIVPEALSDADATRLVTTLGEEAPASKKNKKSTKSNHADSPKKKKKKKRRRKFAFRDVWSGLLPWKGDSIFEVFRKLVFMVSVIGFAICLFLILDYYDGLRRSEALYNELQNQLFSEMEPEIELTRHNIVKVDENGESYEYLTLSDMGEKLLSMNPDAVGYISIDGTKVSYPIVQRRGDESSHGADGLLYRSFDGKESKNGCIFMDFRDEFEIVDNGRRLVPNSENIILYGHNMKDGSMFGTLKNYKNDQTYYDAHPLITLYSNYKEYTYKIFGYAVIDCEDETDTAFDYWNVLGFNTVDEFYDYVNAVKRRTIRNTNVDIEYGDQLLTLSTCNGMFDSARFVVFARLLRDGEDPYEGIEGSTLNDNVLWPTIYYNWNSYSYDPDKEFIPYGPKD